MSRSALMEVTNREALDMVRRMAILAEYHDGEVRHHIERIRGYVAVMARGLEFTPHEVEIVSVAAMLHDVGKINIPVGLQNKADKLDPFEWEIIKKHTVIGADILHDASSPFLQAGEYITLTHHERWDGSGYPRGLSGEEIPFGGRITAIADVFDALITRRPYKQEIPMEEARDLIRSASGQLFDPQMVASFLNHFDDITYVRRLNT